MAENIKPLLILLMVFTVISVYLSWEWATKTDSNLRNITTKTDSHLRNMTAKTDSHEKKPAKTDSREKKPAKTDSREKKPAKTDSHDQKRPPHIVFMIGDDVGFDDVPWHNKVVRAPHLLKLAEESVMLEQSYVQRCCAPTRSAILSGIYPYATGAQKVIPPWMPKGLSLELTLLPEYLKILGYETHAVGKWHLGFCSWAHTPTERGFDTFKGFYTGMQDYYSHRRDGAYDFRNNREVDHKARGIYSSEIFASQAESIFASGDPQVPKFVYMAFQNIHTPNQVPARFVEPYTDIESHRRKYVLGMMSAMDDAVGRIVNAMKDTGHYENSVIIFISDNGGLVSQGASNWPLRGEKGTSWEGGTRGATFIHSPLLPNPGRISNQLIHATDWLATILTIAGGVPPNGTDSISQWEALLGKAPPPREELIYEMIKEPSQLWAGIRVGDHKLLVGETKRPRAQLLPERRSSGNSSSFLSNNDPMKPYYLNSFGNLTVSGSDDTILPPTTPLFLFNLKDDPGEQINLASENPNIVKQLLERLVKTYNHRYVRPDKINIHHGPTNHVWAPGWC